jgi:hypothetical protein
MYVKYASRTTIIMSFHIDLHIKAIGDGKRLMIQERSLRICKTYLMLRLPNFTHAARTWTET